MDTRTKPTTISELQRRIEEKIQVALSKAVSNSEDKSVQAA
jgi:hypothetical protein